MVRGIGLLADMYALSLWLVVVSRLIDPNTSHRFPIVEDVAFGAFWIVVGTLLMRQGGWIVRLAYGPESN
jgi:hypothetical protein